VNGSFIESSLSFVPSSTEDVLRCFMEAEEEG
jgi:hypothetical protein